MDALELLLTRTSTPLLSAPAPSAEQLDIMLQAASRAPDHGSLRPYRFIRIEGEALAQLGELFVEATLTDEPDAAEAKIAKCRAMPLRAPLILAAVAVTQAHPKVPVSEQVITAGCAVHGLIQAAYVQNIGAIWRTGDLSFNAHVARGLGLAEQEQLIGFIYLGQVVKAKPTPELSTAGLLSDWGDA